MSPAQCRAARALLGFSQSQVAEAAGVSYMTVRRGEGSAKPPISADAIAAIGKALERAGVQFIGEIGVKMRRGVTSAQCRAARALIGMSQAEIAASAGVSIPTVKRAEADAGIRVSEVAITALQWVLERAGVEFIKDGVKLRKGGK